MSQALVGQNVPRVDALGKVTGETLYPGDVYREDALFLRILWSERAHARIRAIDTRKAEALPGVVAVFTAGDVPVNEYGLTMYDQPVLCGPGSEREGADVVRTTMDNVALIVAETEAIALQAAKLIEVDYEDLPPVFDPYEAMTDGVPQLHPNTPNNIIVHYEVNRGDTARGFADADLIIEGVYQTGWQEHVYLQPEAGLAYIDDEGRVTVEVAGQHAHKDQQQIAHALDLPLESVRVVYDAVGGAFGGREDMSIQIALGLVAWKLQRPVKTLWSREESMRYHHKRHPVSIKTRWGAKRDGTLLAVEAEIVGDGGAYNYTSNKVLANSTLLVIGPYRFPDVKVNTYAVYTNNIPCGAFRGFGGPQAAYAAESQMNKLAAALGMDPVALRQKNILRDGDLLHVGTPLPEGVTISEVVQACSDQSGWDQKAGDWGKSVAGTGVLWRGIGFAAGYKNVGFSFGYPEKCDAIIELHGRTEIEEVVLRHAAAEVGQGTHTVLAQMAADALGVPIEKVRLDMSDTATSNDSGSVSASRMTFMAGNAIRGAAQRALEAWEDEERPAAAQYTYRPPRTTMFEPKTGKSEPNFAYGYCAQMVELEVDVETGHIHILDVYCANDVGRAVNPRLVQGQIEGCVVQAQGYVTMEHFQMKDGHVMTPFLSNYLIPTILDVPVEVHSIILEYPDPLGPSGARGMGEMPFLPFAGAVAAALYDATGVWFDEIPLTPDRVVKKLREHGIGA